MHIVSEITGKINQNLSPMTVIANLLPTGTVSGAPKLRAIERNMNNIHINEAFIVVVLDT